jgi:hypothetical protein
MFLRIPGIIRKDPACELGIGTGAVGSARRLPRFQEITASYVLR